MKTSNFLLIGILTRKMLEIVMKFKLHTFKQCVQISINLNNV